MTSHKAVRPLTDDTGLSKIFAEEYANYVMAGGDPMQRWLSHNYEIFVLLFFFVVGFSFHALDSYNHWLDDRWYQSAIHMFCDALAVAGVLGLTVDTLLKRALIRDVGAIFIGWALPDEIKNYIREVSQTAIVRRDYKAQYTFTKQGDELVIDVTEECDVFNYSTGFCTYRRYMAINSIDKPSDDITYEYTAKNGKSKLYKSGELKEIMKKEGTRFFYDLGSKILCSQDVMDPKIKPACHMKWKYRITKNLEDGVLTHSIYATMGMTIRVHCLGCKLRFEFDPDDNVIHTPGSDEWRIPALFMPQQQLQMRWYPDPGEVPATS